MVNGDRTIDIGNISEITKNIDMEKRRCFGVEKFKWSFEREH